MCSNVYQVYPIKEFQSFIGTVSIYLQNLANLRGVMRHCYHKECDSPSNPKINIDQGIQFLELIAQSMVLLVANISGGKVMGKG